MSLMIIIRDCTFPKSVKIREPIMHRGRQHQPSIVLATTIGHFAEVIGAKHVNVLPQYKM